MKKIDIKNLPQSKKEILIEIPFRELEESINKAAINLGKKVKLDGFREGRVPLELIKEKLGKETLLEEAIRIEINRAYQDVLKDYKLEVIGMPKIEILNSGWEKPLEFKIEITVLPEVKLPDYREIASKVKPKKVNVNDSEVEETLKWIQKSRAKYASKISPVKEGDLVSFSYSSKALDEGKERKDQFVVGKGHLLPGLDKALIGMSPGEEKEIELEFPPNHIVQKLAGKKVLFKLRVDSVQRMELPEINDEWARSLGNFENLEKLKESIREGIRREKENMESQRLQGEILEKIAEKTDVEIPQLLIDLELEGAIRESKDKITKTFGISFEEYLKQAKLSEDQFKESLLPQVKKRIKEFLIIQAIKKKEKIEATNEEIEREANKYLSQFESPESAEKAIDPETLIAYTKDRIENQKTLQFLEKLSRKNADNTNSR